MKKVYERFDQASEFLPVQLRRYAMELSIGEKARAEEFRLRAGRQASVVLEGKEKKLGGADDRITANDLELMCSVAADYSRYASMETLRRGYLTVRGGFRIGFCGTTVIKDGAVTNLKNISSASIRISREYKGIAEKTVKELFTEGRFQSTLIVSPPGCGKTTFLRDAVRTLGNGGTGFPASRVALIDERGEIAVMHCGMPQMDVGERTDVLDACPKAEGILMMLRAMNPEIIAVDEITAPEDITAMNMAANCGTALLATIHAQSREELLRKPLYEELLRARVFSRLVRIKRCDAGRMYTVEEL